MSNVARTKSLENLLTILHSFKKDASMSFNEIAKASDMNHLTAVQWLELINAIKENPPNVIIDTKERLVKSL